MTTRSARLWGPVVVASSSGGVLATVPAGETWIVKSTRFVNTTDSQRLLSVALDVLEPESALYWQTRVGQGGITVSSLWEVFHAGEQLVAWCDGADALVSWGSGARLPEA